MVSVTCEPVAVRLDFQGHQRNRYRCVTGGNGLDEDDSPIGVDVAILGVDAKPQVSVWATPTDVAPADLEIGFEVLDRLILRGDAPLYAGSGV